VLSREAIVSAKEKPIGVVSVPEWSGEVGIRALSAQELVDMRDMLDIDHSNTNAVMDSFCQTAAALMVDDEGNRLFSREDTAVLRSRGLRLLSRIVEEGKRLNGIGESQVADTEKNSAGEPT
jgi:hypothetical protein